ncbi:MAG TPA: DUF4124 domain-containing protein [Steroidobacteraceae bacterium]|nr:DUF4124 domain-containing protein [Steroidobacteraceae bacterium]
MTVLAGPLAVRAAVVYRWIDADGVVHYSDQPVPGAEKIITATGTGNGILNQTPPGTAPADQPRKPTSLGSAVVSITSPAQGQTFSGAEVMAAHLSIEPEVSPEHPMSISWTLNGATVGEADGATSFTLPDLPRGTYTLAATVTDPQTGESKSADPVTFNVLRPSLLAPQHK